MVKEIPLQNGMVALVDDEDYERCMEFNWYVSLGNTSKFYVYARFGGKKTSLQEFLLNSKENKIFAFVNGNRLDFRKNNLAFRTHKESARWSKGKRGTSSKYKGVSFYKKIKKWRAGIRIDGKSIWLGDFENEDDAARAFNAKAFELWGDDCYMNEIGEDNNAESRTMEKSNPPRLKKKSTSIYRGVNKCGVSWRAGINDNGNTVYIGKYQTEIEAAKAYDKKAIELRGNKAILNFPNE